MTTLRDARTGDLLPSALLPPRPARRLSATAILLPGQGDIGPYADRLRDAAPSFAAWDGRVAILEPDGAPNARVLVVDRYRQVYAVDESATDAGLPTPHDVEEWFRFLSTACPECGVIDDPVRSGPTP